MHNFRVFPVLALALLTTALSSTVALAETKPKEFNVGTGGDTGAEAQKNKPYSPNVDHNYPTNVYFGDTHVHTALSADAGGAGTTMGPRDAYRFARGEEVTTNSGQRNKLRVPYDFFMITDHSDAMGMIQDLIKGTPEIMATPDGKRYHEEFAKGGDAANKAMWDMIAQFGKGELPPELNYQPGNPAYERVWQDLLKAAEEFNDPGKFTTFAAFEWSSIIKGNNLHRNVVFRDGPDRTGQVVPYTTSKPQGSTDPSDLWKWLENYEETTGGDVLAIPHNGNLSNGMMFSLNNNFIDGDATGDFRQGPEIDADYAANRQKWERLYEATQMKGDGEANPVLSPDDEFADFETWSYGNLDATQAKTDDMLPGEYARSGLKRGLEMDAKLGVNPFKFGLVGAGDNHVAMPSPQNDNYFGKYANYEPNPHRIVGEDGSLHVALENKDLGIELDSYQYITSGVTAVWAKENTRAAIFDAMQRREVYATTGTRIKVRFFAGWDFDETDVKSRNPADVGYAKGVPMGSDMKPASEGAKAPSFLVFATRDATGANLDRIQIIKGWLDADGNAQEKVYDVAWSGDRTADANGKVPAVGDTVDLSIPSWSNTIGAPELGTVWTDPDFDPSLRAFYYARVIEIPTPRWTAYDKVRFDIKDMPDSVPMKTQERAYTSPIWYTPTEKK